ncbi:hypothetical protein [Caldimonas brevitalea]|uniref:Tetratricopeptide repeat protein n=1 Tax=Caldimonas brevitalea TaxID=413882 RepID=A0A0G3BQE2_9BURK|nr:hypothetical protein [Caldimonas brevitalea]AKJ30203.1 hypothetical protein AAW51_3512 [Caldimonas brevitalea]
MRAKAKAATVAIALLVAGAAAASAEPAPDQVIEARLLPLAVKRQVALLAAVTRQPATSDAAGSPAPPPAAARRAVAHALGLLQQARAEGDPRLVAYAHSTLQPWWDRNDAPLDMVVAIATVEQAQHQFTAARRRLEQVLRPGVTHPQAWLTLSTLALVQGDHAAAGRACEGLAAAVAEIALLCRLQVDTLTGAAEAALPALRVQAGVADPRRATWAASVLGETLARLGQYDAALTALQQAAAGGELYDLLALADTLIVAGRPQAALQALVAAPPSDGVLLRRWRAAQAGGERRAAEALRQQLQTRLSAMPADEAALHAREQALFVLWSGGDAAEARRWAALNLGLQSEPIDLRIAAEAAHRAGDRDLLAEVERRCRTSGLRDHRLAAALQGFGTPRWKDITP